MSVNTDILKLASVNAASRRFNRIKKKDNPEGRLQLEILHYLRGLGFPCGKVKTKGSFNKGSFIKDRYQWTGLPDLLVFTPKLLFLEIKVGKNSQTPNQKDFQQFCEKANVKYFVVKSLEDVISAIK